MAARQPALGSEKRTWLSAAPEGFGRKQVIEIQRTRILDAMLDVAVELGASKVSVAHVVERCGVSRRTFYELFADRDDCLLAALDDALERIAAVVVPAYEGKGRALTGASVPRGASWHARIRTALVELLAFFESEPRIARLVVVESFAGGPRTLACRNDALARVILAIDAGREEATAGAQPNALSAEGVVGGVSAVIHTRLLSCSPVPGGVPRGPSLPSDEGTGAGHPLDLLELTNQLMVMVVLPYLGQAAARRELARPTPKRVVAAAPERNGANPLHDLGMRLTYRTVRVLDAVASNPGSSNRVVGDASGVSDQGQISKLLTRLERLGLLSNMADGAPVRGEPNEWCLTATGERLASTIRAHTSTTGPRRAA